MNRCTTNWLTPSKPCCWHTKHIPDVVCKCGARNNMDGDLLHSHRISLIDNAIEDVLNGEGM